MDFIEVTDRNSSRKLTLNTYYIVKISDDGTDGVITYLGAGNRVETIAVDESYSALKTAVGV